MRNVSTFITTGILFLFVALSAAAGEVENKMEQAEKLAGSGDFPGAVALLEKVTAEYPENSDALAYLGLYTGMGAGQAADYEEAGRLMMLSFERLDKAVILDEENPRARLFRGIMGIKVPGFFGRLDPGISDLEHAVKLYSSASSPEASEGLVTSLTMLAEGYGKKEDPASRKKALERIVEIAPGTVAADAAEKQLEGLKDVEEKPEIDAGIITPRKGDSEKVLAVKKSLEKDPGDTALLLQLGEIYYEEGSFTNAREVLKGYTAIDQSSADACKMLALSTARIAEKGYDENIYDDTDYLSGLAFETMAGLDKAVDLAPDDIELRLTRGTFGLLMPFFLGKHDQSVADLEMVAESDGPEPVKSEALFYLGYARRREALKYWIKVAKEYPGSNGSKLVFNEMRPQVARLAVSEYDTPCVKIDFVLGFQDELAPQTAVWIEDKNEHYIATVYVSGFAGFVKEKQVTLPIWAAISRFEGIDGITSASIDVGHHIYVWDLKDHQGNKVKKGTYKVRVETSYWPTMLYQNIEALINVGKKTNSVKVEEGDFIPYFEVTYVK